jgi:O-antigen/teichoic acid export membrane protein
MITRVLRNGLWLGAGETAVKSGLLMISVLIARGSGPAAVGTFSIAFGAALVGIMLLAFGQQEVLIREVARTPDHARSLLNQSRYLQRRLAGWLLPPAAAAALLVADSGLRLTLLAFVPYVALRTAVVTRGAVFKGLDRMDVEVRARALEITIAVLGISAVVVLGWPLWSTGVVFSVGAAVGLAWISRTTRTLEYGLSPEEKLSTIREGLPFMFLAVLGQLLVNTDRFLLAALGVSRVEIGYWGAAATVVWASVAVPQLVAVAAYPTFSRMALDGTTWRRAGLVSIAAGLAGGAVCALVLRQVAGPLVGVLFGSDFGPAVVLMRRMAWVLPGAFTAMVVGTVYAAWRRQDVAMWILAGAFCASVALNVVYIPVIGAIACANAAVAAYSAAAAVMIAGFALPVVVGRGSS